MNRERVYESIEYKLQAIEIAEENSIHHAAKVAIQLELG